MTVPTGIRGHLPPRSDEKSGITVVSERLGPLVPLMSNSPHQWLAADGMILRTEVGSTVHGTAVGGQDDIDEMGIFLEPPGTVIGSKRIEHYTYRTQPEGVCSGPGDLDLVAYCHDPASRVLTTDLTWEPIEKIAVGDRLVSFDEAAPTRARHRHFATGTVMASQTRIMQRRRVHTDQGPTVVTPDHPFLVRFEAGPRMRWVTAEDLRPGDRIYHVEPWTENRSWEAGYLAGQFDADGYLSFGTSAEGGSTWVTAWTQKSDSPDVPFVEAALAGMEFSTRRHGPNSSGCDQVHVSGTWVEQMRFLGAVRPRRLLRHPELARLWEGRSLQSCGKATVQRVESLPDGPMVAMEVDKRTYVADGMLTHNSARKFCYLAAKGNATVLLPLWVPDDKIRYANEFGAELRENRRWFVSKRAGQAFRGYLESQRRGLMGLRSGGTRNQGRADIRAKYGHDVKFAGHMVRLGMQGVALLRTGELPVPLPEPELSKLQEVRRGERTKQQALDMAEALEKQLDELIRTAPIPEWPDQDAIDRWLEKTHRKHWGWV